MIPVDGAGLGCHSQGVTELRLESMSHAPGPVMSLLCCVALASVGAIRNRKEEEEEEANVDAVTVQTACWVVAPLASWAVLQAGLQGDEGPPLSRRRLYVRPLSFRASEESEKHHQCPATVLAWQEISERHPYRAWTGCWSLVLGAALVGSMKWHWYVSKGGQMWKVQDGALAVCRVLSSSFQKYQGVRRTHSRQSSSLPGPPAVFQVS